jgi:hypothetical protein
MTESGASTSFATPHKVRAKKLPTATLDSFDEAVVHHTTNEFM